MAAVQTSTLSQMACSVQALDNVSLESCSAHDSSFPCLLGNILVLCHFERLLAVLSVSCRDGKALLKSKETKIKELANQECCMTFCLKSSICLQALEPQIFWAKL